MSKRRTFGTVGVSAKLERALKKSREAERKALAATKTPRIVQTATAVAPSHRDSLSRTCSVYGCDAACLAAIRVGGGPEGSASTVEVRVCCEHAGMVAASLRALIEAAQQGKDVTRG